MDRRLVALINIVFLLSLSIGVGYDFKSVFLGATVFTVVGLLSHIVDKVNE